MNKIIREQIEAIGEMHEALEDLICEWQEKLDEKENTETQSYEKLETKISNLQDVIDSLEDIGSQLESVEEE
jgi:uncharacterized damage-inducible protein DinB